jgi:hypothetical protein
MSQHPTRVLRVQARNGNVYKLKWKAHSVSWTIERGSAEIRATSRSEVRLASIFNHRLTLQVAQPQFQKFNLRLSCNNNRIGIAWVGASEVEVMRAVLKPISLKEHISQV